MISISNKKGLNKFCCNKCIKNNYRYYESNSEISSNYEQLIESINYDVCSSCENIKVLNKDNLCLICKKKWEIKNCCLCRTKYLNNKNNLFDLYCDECEKNMIKCNECGDNCMKPQVIIGLCNECHYVKQNNLKRINCEVCKKKLFLDESEKFKSHCNTCYKNSITNVNCDTCGLQFKRLPKETWRKFCSNCWKNKK
jgi:hypothetical protein